MNIVNEEFLSWYVYLNCEPEQIEMVKSNKIDTAIYLSNQT